MNYWKDADGEQIQAFMDAAPVFMHATDSEGKITALSTYWARFLGYERDALIGQRSLDLLEPQSRKRTMQHLLPTLEDSGQVHNVDVDFVRSDGTILPVLMSSRRLVDDSGQVITTMSVFFDNSVAKEAQRQLVETARAAEEASRAKSRFLAAMSHEIRTPMNAIIGFAQLLKLSTLDDRRKRHVDAILNAGGTLMNLLTDLLDLSQIEEGAMRIDPREFDLYALIDQIADWWYSSAQNKGLKLIVTVDRSLPRLVRSDPVRIQQVLNNLLGNAVKFTEAGSVTLSVGLVSPGDTTCRVRFEVADTGPGMREDQLEHLFRPFVQIETDFSKDRGGWGLGLSICANIADHMDADIGAVSEPGNGSVFHFTVDLDVSRSDHVMTTNAPYAPSNPGENGLKILLAEDNLLNQNMMSELLTSMGHSVSVAKDGFAAVEAAHETRYDLILMDIMMPGLDGIKAAEQIRASDSASLSVPIVACSAHVGDDTQDRFRELGMNDFLAKPIDTDALKRLIGRISDEKRAADAAER